LEEMSLLMRGKMNMFVRNCIFEAAQTRFRKYIMEQIVRTKGKKKFYHLCWTSYVYEMILP
jgi:hypothetical protein